MKRHIEQKLSITFIGLTLSSLHAMERNSNNIDSLVEIASKYRAQVFNLTSEYPEIYRDKSCSFSGVGFVYNPQDNIIFTSAQICPSYCATFLSHTREDGSSLETPDINILGTTPAERYGSYGFLRFKEEYTHKEILTMEIDDIPPPIKMNIAYFICKDNILKIETGHIIKNYDYNKEMDFIDRGMHCYKASFSSSPASLGSPVFSPLGKLIGLVHEIIPNKHQMKITPIWYIYQGYQQLLLGQKPYVNTLSLGLFTYDIKLLSQITSIPFSALKQYANDENKLFMCDNQYVEKDSKNNIIANDILLSINGEKIGGDLIKMTQLLKKGESALVEIYRSDQQMTLSITPDTITQSFYKFIDVDGVKVISTPHIHSLGTGFPLKSARIIPTNNNYEKESITHIKNIKTPTFNDFIIGLYNVVENQKKDYFYIRSISIQLHLEYHNAQDLTQWRGKTFYVIHFDRKTCQWKQTDYKDYVQLLKKKK